MGVKYLQLFDLDRWSSLFAYLREIGKLFPLVNGPLRGRNRVRNVAQNEGRTL